jgi:nucleotide-binding universal stress UspA family protein
MYEKIVVGTDMSSTSKVAVERAAGLASKLGAQLFLVHAGTDPGEPLQELAAQHEAEAVVVRGNPAEALLAESDKLGAGLLVVGSVGMSGAKRFMLGNVPNKISHHTDRDLLIVRTHRPSVASGEYSKILIGTDGSSTATRAVKMAGAVARSLGAKVTLVTAYQPPTEQELKQLRAGTGDAISTWGASKVQRETPPEFQWRIAGASQAEDVLDRANDCAAEVGVDAELRALEGPAAEMLLELAETERFDLIAVGSVGMTGPKRFMLGNVPHRLSHHTPTDILILHTA